MSIKERESICSLIIAYFDCINKGGKKNRDEEIIKAIYNTFTWFYLLIHPNKKLHTHMNINHVLCFIY